VALILCEVDEEYWLVAKVIDDSLKGGHRLKRSAMARPRPGARFGEGRGRRSC